MAKGQKRSNREIRKPKAVKKVADVATARLLAKGETIPFAAAKKKP